jgi:molybdopterin-containing oxidoreductase family iron-sulfur binding subunit
MGTTKKYWTGLNDLHDTQEFRESAENEFPKDLAIDEFLGNEKLSETSSSRRDFLKFMGFSLTAASLAACETPVIKSIPYVEKPQDIIPGVANHYASTYYDGQDYGNIMVKTREGRPIFIKPNKSKAFSGGINARINASVLGLYDGARLQAPLLNKNVSSWADLDAAVISALAASTNIRLLTSTIISPSFQRAIDAFISARPGAKHVTYDAVSYAGIRKANTVGFGVAIIPTYDFSKAKAIVSVGADFLNSWLLPTVFTSQYAATRNPASSWMSKHIQIEANLSLAGSNADERYAVKPSAYGAMVAAIYNSVANKLGQGASITVSGEVNQTAADRAAEALVAAKGESLLVCGSNESAVQELVNATNVLLGNYGSTIDLSTPVHLFKGDDAAMTELVNEMNTGSVDFLLVHGVNPSYSWVEADKFRAGLSKVKFSISTSLYEDETASLCSAVAPDRHYLESWNDFNPSGSRIDLAQPVISPLFDSRQAGESLLRWAGIPTDYYTWIRSTINPAYTPLDLETDQSWNMGLYNGTLASGSVSAGSPANPVFTDTAADASGRILAPAAGWEVLLYQKTAIGAGNQTNNPWLQELPDPISKVTWDNYIAMCPSDVEEGGYNYFISQEQPASLATVTVNGISVTLPVIAQPGQAKGCLSIAIGYGRGANGEKVGKAAFQTEEGGDFSKDENGNPVSVGRNVFGFASVRNGEVVYYNSGEIVKSDGTYPLACTQIHHTLMDRTGVLKETDLNTYSTEKAKAKGQASYNIAPGLVVHEDVNADGVIDSRDKKSTRAFDLWHAHPVEAVGHRWGMTIDLNGCIGCGACVTACHLENNVPVVGKDEVRRARDMHWMRIDRYYSSAMTKERGKEEGLGKIDMYSAMERPEDQPRTVHMPMMCQHCNHAPCETVCPVVATTHSNEGLNQMTYNRCIGTRYCANNCPFKVRRFNWFNYQAYKKFKNVNPAQDELTRMVLNPDVTVRSRGVMEKCSMCVQRIQQGKLAAKKESRPVEDQDVVTACAEACPTHAITFGDLNSKTARIAGVAEDVRAYHALEEIGVQPNIFYLTKVRNTESNEA